MFTGFNLGSALVGFGAALILADYGWRMVLVAGGVIPLVCMPLYLFLIPESVRFMVGEQIPGRAHRRHPAPRGRRRQLLRRHQLHDQRTEGREQGQGQDPAVADFRGITRVAVGHLLHGPAGDLPAAAGCRP
jgi:MFS family permease